MAVVVSALLAAPPVFAHHSFSPHFDANKPANIFGTITRFEARNPHSYLHIAAEDENGRTREYVCESNGVTQLARIGLTPAVLKVGLTVRVRGSMSRHSAYMCFFNSVEFADGRIMSASGAGTALGPATLPKRSDIFGTWLLAPTPGRSTSGPQPMIHSLTPAGEKATAAYDPFKDDPTFRCEPVGIRRLWFAPGTPVKIGRDGANIVLQYEWMDVKRVIHLDLKDHAKGGPRSSLGHSIGHFEGDTLVIETANFSAGVMNQYVEEAGQPTKGLLHSAALTSVERLHLDATRQRLVVDLDFVDSEFFTQPFPRATTEYAPSGLTIEPFNCSREGLTGTRK